MRIGVNAVPLRVNGGGARYVFSELLERLFALDQQNEYIIFAHPYALGVVHQLARVHRHLHPEFCGRRVRVVEVDAEERVFDYRDEFDLYFGPLNNLQPRIYDRPSVAILHDIQEQFFPQYFKPDDLRARNEIYPEICRSATTLVTISEFCKSSIVQRFGIDPARIEVVYNAPQSGLIDRPADDPGRWMREPLRSPFFFYPANCYLHKNHDLLLRVAAAARDSGAPFHLVFTGFELPGGFALRDEIERRGLSGYCQVFESVSADELRYLYRHAMALVMPTQFEGFGLPAVEALACGCPVVCSDLPALREICGANALYFPVDSAAGLRTCLERIATDAPTRARLADQGPVVAARFSWDNAAKRMLEIFRATPQRFAGDHDVTSRAGCTLPRIGVLVNGTEQPAAVGEAVRSVLATGHRNLAIRVALPPGGAAQPVTDYLDGAQVRYSIVTESGPSDWTALSRFAREEGLDLVGELVAGRSRLLPTALQSLTWGWSQAAVKPLYLGEAWQEPGGGPVRSVARLRVLGDGNWKFEGFVYPELLFLAPLALARWELGLTIARANGPDWRWQLLKAARQAEQLFLLRRSLAVCDPARVALGDRLRAAAAGVEAVYAEDGRLRGGWLQRLKPVLKPASLVLPAGLRRHGESLWRQLTRA